MVTAKRLKRLVNQILLRYGHLVTFSRATGFGATRKVETFVERVLYVPLTPTFAHDVHMESDINALENDQSDLTLCGDTNVREGDTLVIDGVQYVVTTVAQSTISGVNVSQHALILRSVEG
jgi:hypothetical protein